MGKVFTNEGDGGANSIEQESRLRGDYRHLRDPKSKRNACKALGDGLQSRWLEGSPRWSLRVGVAFHDRQFDLPDVPLSRTMTSRKRKIDGQTMQSEAVSVSADRHA